MGELASSRAAIALTPAQGRTVARIVEQVIPGALVYVFGSRATAKARPFSDLDLLIVQPAPLSWANLADLRDLFEASDLPFRVDVVEASGLSAAVAERAASESVGLGTFLGVQAAA